MVYCELLRLSRFKILENRVGSPFVPLLAKIHLGRNGYDKFF